MEVDHYIKMSEDVIKKISMISQLCIQGMDSNDEHFLNLETSKQSLKILSKTAENLEFLTNMGNSSFDKIEHSKARNVDYASKLNLEIETLKEKQKQLEETKTVAEEHLAGCKQKMSHLKDKQNHLQKKRDEILVYKLLTNTNFHYNSKNVKGYTLGDDTPTVKCFDIPQSYPPEKITEKLYLNIQEVCNKTKQQENNLK